MQGTHLHSGPASTGALDLSSLFSGQKKQVQLPGGAHLASQHLAAHALFAAQAVALAVEQAAASEDLITPASAEAPAAGVLLPEAVPARPPPAAPAQCLFCGGLGGEGTCGPLRRATLDGQPVAVHHLCAIWSPGCYLPEGSATYVNLEAEARRAKGRACSACGQLGAAVPCSHPWCRNAYHLPCAQAAPGVVLDGETFELWCPGHAETEGNSDEEYTAAPAPPRPRRQTGSAGGSGSAKRPRGTSSEAQRPRTDWQKKDENTWLKVVPPWWCEQRTVHFATKVYKELFRSAGSAVLVDSAGGEWLCLVQTEARNDNRPQYTLRGAFAELWQAQGISAGDTLIFKRDPLTGHIELSRHAAGSGAATGARLEEAAASELSDPGSAQQQPEVSGGGGGWRSRAPRQEASSDNPRGQSQQGSHPNRWMELADGWAIKTVYKSTLAHQQCPIAGWLFKKLYGRLPGEADRAPVYDPDLDAEYRFDVSFVSAANVHYITGRTFSSWVRESGLQAGEQIRMRREGPTGRVVIQRVPSDRKVRVDFTTKAASRSVSMAAGLSAEAAVTAAVAGAPAALGHELASPPTAEALEALDALVAAAGYAGTHGTPAIQAALAGAGADVDGAVSVGAAQAAGLGMAAAAAAAAAAALPLPKRQRIAGEEEGGAAAELLLQQQELAVLSARQGVGGVAGLSSLPGFSLASWQPSSPHVAMFQAINEILAAHQWSSQEQAELLRFRAKYAWLDSCGREVAYLTITQLREDKAALLEFLQAAGQGILTQLPGATSGTAAGTGAGAGVSLALPHVGVSPFAAAAAAAAISPAAPAAAALQVEEQQQQQQMLGGMCGAAGAATSMELPTAADEGGLGLAMDIEGASSFNLGGAAQGHYFAGTAARACAAAEVKEEQEQGETPGPTAPLGPEAV